MSIKLVQISPAYKPAFIYGGPTMSVAKMCEALVQEKIDLEVFTTTANGTTELQVKAGQKQVVDGVEVTYFKRLTKDHTHFSPALLSALRNLARNFKHHLPNAKLIVHIHAWWNLVSIFTCFIAKKFGIPVVLSPRGMLTTYTMGNRNSISKSIIHHTIGKNLLKYCHIHATSEKEKQDILNLISPKSITVIPNLIDLPQQQLAQNHILPTENTHFKLLFLSRIEEKKGLDLLFEALKGLEMDWTLTLAGTGENSYLNSLKEKAENLGIADRLNWVGHINNISKFEVMATHDLTVLTSYNENFANVVIESLSVGTPVLLSSQVGLANYVAENNLGWIAELDPLSIQQQIDLAFKELLKRVKIRETAPIFIERDFNSTTLVQHYISLYKQLS